MKNNRKFSLSLFEFVDLDLMDESRINNFQRRQLTSHMLRSFFSSNFPFRFLIHLDF